MFSRLMRIATLVVIISLLVTGCMLTSTIDRNFFGLTVTYPKYEDRMITGLVLLPIAVVLDIVTFPVQAVLVLIYGDDYPYGDKTQYRAGILNNDPLFQKLSEEQKMLALSEFKRLQRSGTLSKNTAIAILQDGHCVPVKIDARQRAQLLARTQSVDFKTLAFAR